MGRFAIDVELANGRDLVRAKLGHISSDQVRKVGVLAVVGTRATRLVLPAAIVEQLGLEITETTKARYPDGRTVQLPLATQVHLAYGGRSGNFNAVVDPDKDRALIRRDRLERTGLRRRLHWRASGSARSEADHHGRMKNPPRTELVSSRLPC